MKFTTADVSALADSVQAAPSDLLTTGNPKTAKGEGYGYLTAILHLSPHKASGSNLCAGATAGCIAACLNTSGQGMMSPKVHIARIRKSKWFKADREAFMAQIEKEIRAHIKRAKRNDLLPAVRLNGTSDIPWENVRYSDPRRTIFEAFPDVQFYDYTKLPLRFKKGLPANYDLTFSMADGNENAADFVLNHNGRVAVVFRNILRPTLPARFWNLPDNYKGIKVVDADKHDLRFLDPHGVYCGLKAKGLATIDNTGFVHDIYPA